MKPWRRKPEDRVSNDVAAKVFARDGFCVPYLLLAPGACADRAGHPILPTQTWLMTLDHCKDEPGMGKRAPSDPEHLITACAFHHLESSWVTGNRPLIRRYLTEVQHRPSLDAALWALGVP